MVKLYPSLVWIQVQTSIFTFFKIRFLDPPLTKFIKLYSRKFYYICSFLKMLLYIIISYEFNLLLYTNIQQSIMVRFSGE